MIKAVIFDIDGTIGDTVPFIIEAFHKAIEPLTGRSVSDEEITATFGPSEEATIKALVPGQYDAALLSYHEWYQKLHERSPLPFEGITDILAYIKSRNLKLGVVTGKGRYDADYTLKKYGVKDFFEAVETGSPDGPCKPRRIRSLLKRFGLDPHEAVYVGDVPGDITAAREAGVPIISAAWASTAQTEKLREMNPEATFESVEAFGEYIKRFI